jgi:predicted RNA polymerase sigma factor
VAVAGPRLTRAKQRIKAAGIAFRIPGRADLPARMASVLEAVYGAYVIDWATGPQARRLPSEALHLAEVLATLVLGSGVALAAVTAEVDGPAAGLAALDALLAEGGQPARWFQPAKATRAHLLDRLGRKEEAVAAYDSAISLTHEIAERQYLEHRRDRAAGPR